jgi:hypothetical protein
MRDEPAYREEHKSAVKAALAKVVGTVTHEKPKQGAAE